MPIQFTWSGTKDAEAFYNKHVLFQSWMEPGLGDLFLLQEACREYFRNRQYEHHEAPGRTAILLGVSRMQYLLEYGREALAEKFALEDIIRLLDVMCGDMPSPVVLENPVSPIADTFGWESHADIPEDWRHLVATLESLSPLERVALADLLERLWYVKMPNRKGIDEELLHGMGVVLKPAQAHG